MAPLKKVPPVVVEPGPYTCRRGHPRTPENTAVRANGYRECKDCRRITNTEAVARYRTTWRYRFRGD